MKRKFTTGIIFGVLIGINSFCGFAQQVYFNNIYNLCSTYDPEAWSATDGIIIELTDGYILCGATVDTTDFWMRRIPFMKIGLDGEMIWKKDYGDPECDYYTGESNYFLKTVDDHFYISGSINYWQPTNYDVGLLMKLDNQFDSIWIKTYDLNLDEQKDTSLIFNQMDACSNGDFVFGGWMNGSYMLLWRTDSSGNTQWYKTFHYGTNTLCTGYSVIQTSDEGFALGGFMYTIGQPESGNSVIIKTDSLGNQEWVKFLGGPYMDNKAMLSRSPDGNIVMGTTYGEAMIGNNPISRTYIVKLDNAGNIIWQNKYGESQMYNFLLNIRTLEDGSIIASGSINDPNIYHGWILKIDMNGDSVWYRKKRYLTGENSLHYLYDIIPTSDKGFISCGYVAPIYPDTGINSSWVMKLDSLGCDTAGCDPTVGIDEEPGGMEAGVHRGIQIWPNPASDIVNCQLSNVNGRKKSSTFNLQPSISIYDIFGREMISELLSSTRMGGGREGGWTVDVSALPSGIYFVVVRDERSVIGTGKFVVAR
jgi:hypothetical protein